jgi:uncharacterized RDD family membrane protein YckC
MSDSAQPPKEAAIAGMGIRFAALAVDWLATSVIITGLTGKNYGYEGERLLLFFAEVVLLTSLMGASAGQRLFRLRVVDVDTGGSITPIRAILRTLLIILVLPALFRRDGAAFHDSVCKTRVVRS